jgi:hypothetical protein
MKTLFLFCLMATLALGGANILAAARRQTGEIPAAQTATENSGRRTLHVAGSRRRKVRGDRRRSRGIGGAYASAGKGAARGAKGFASNISRGRVLRAGKELGKGMGEFGKQTGIGTARVGKKVGKTTGSAVKRAVTP